jgi:transposase
MTIAPDLVAQILRLHTVEKWRVGTIARQLHVHHDTVRRVLASNSVPGLSLPGASPLRPSRMDPYRPFILATLEKFPTLTAARLHAMVVERGYVGCTSHFRALVALIRPRPAAEAYLRLRTLPGEQAQVDWGHFGHLQIGRARRPLMAFVMVLSHSRMVFLRFFLDARMDSFLRGHALAFIALRGVPRVLLYDNLKSAVLERVGDAIRFNPTLLALAGHYRFEPRPVAPARGNEKGRVERAIRYIRDSFFAGRTFSDLDDLNAQAQVWCLGTAADRRWHEDGTLSVRQAFEVEIPKLLPLPTSEFALGERVAVTVDKTPYIRFDLNDYSVPHTHVRRTLAVLADERTVRILDGAAELARHDRCWDRGQQIEDPAHVQRLVEHKRAARAHRACDRLAQAAPAASSLLERAAARGDNLGSITAALLRLLQRYGAAALQAAVTDALDRGVPHPNAVRLALERAREAAGQPPPVALVLPEHVASRDAPVRPHALGSYDRQHDGQHVGQCDDPPDQPPDPLEKPDD